MNNELLTKNYCKPATGNWQLYSTTVESSLQIRLFMQNKAKFLEDQINLSSFITTNYEQRTMNYEVKNKAKQTQTKPNFKTSKTNATSISAKDYEENHAFGPRQNKPNSNPNKPNL